MTEKAYVRLIIDSTTIEKAREIANDIMSASISYEIKSSEKYHKFENSYSIELEANLANSKKFCEYLGGIDDSLEDEYIYNRQSNRDSRFDNLRWANIEIEDPD